MTQFKGQDSDGNISRAIAIDPLGWQCSLCQTCMNAIARRVKADGRKGRWRHQCTGSVKCVPGETTYPARIAEPLKY